MREYVAAFLSVKKPSPVLRGAARALMLFAPLVMLLVGSCKEADLPGAYGSNASPEQFRVALFPDQVRADDKNAYRPARGYVLRAQTYVADTPENLGKLTLREIDYLFGQPGWARHDAIANAKVWQYSEGDCVVDFYFYDTSRAAPAVSYADVRRRNTARPLDGDDQAACLKSIMRAG